MKYGWSLCVTLLCGCSTLKTASLHDARILDQGKWEFTEETSVTASISKAVLRQAERDNPNVGPIVDSVRDTLPDSRIGGLLSEIGIARGMSGGWEWNAALGASFGGTMLEAGLKKRIAMPAPPRRPSPTISRTRPIPRSRSPPPTGTYPSTA
jgi:hypothetical protein